MLEKSNDTIETLPLMIRRRNTPQGEVLSNFEKGKARAVGGIRPAMLEKRDCCIYQDQRVFISGGSWCWNPARRQFFYQNTNTGEEAEMHTRHEICKSPFHPELTVKHYFCFHPFISILTFALHEPVSLSLRISQRLRFSPKKKIGMTKNRK